MQLSALWDMPESPDGFTNDAGNKYKAFMYANLIAEGKVSVNVFAYDDNSAESWERGSALYQFAAEARELQASLHSAFPFQEGCDATRNSSTPLAGHTANSEPSVETTTTPECTKFAGSPSNTRKPWQGPVNCGVYARAFREASPFLCVHVVAVNPNAYPAMANFQVYGMRDAIAAGADGPLAANCRYMGNPGQPAPEFCALRLFDQQYAVNITAVVATETVAFSDMIAGSSAAVYRIGTYGNLTIDYTTIQLITFYLTHYKYRTGCAIPPLPMPKDEGQNLVFDGANVLPLLEQ
jgi:hypothetical protein